MALNPFQQGQAFAANQAQAKVNLEADRRRERGINALAEQFGAGAEAPSEFAALKSGERADRTQDFREEQADLENERTDEDRARANQIQATRNAVGFFQAGIANGVPMEELGQRAGPGLLALGVPEEELAPLLQQIQADPAVLDELEGALKAQQSELTRRVTRTVEVENPDGSIGLLNVFNDGSMEPLEGVTAARTQQFAQGVERNRLRDAEAQGDIAAAKATGKAAGEIAAEDLPGSETGRIANESARAIDKQREEFLIETVDMAIDQANSWTTGLGSVVKIIPGTPQADLAANLDTIKANIGFAELQRMRDNSKTGGALGQVSEMENRLLQSVLGALEQSQSPAQFKSNLERLKKVKEEGNKRIARAYEQDYGVKYQGTNSPLGDQRLDTGGPEGTDALLQKYGIE